MPAATGFGTVRDLRAIIVFDPSEEYLQGLRSDPRTEKFPVLAARTGPEATAWLRDPEHWIVAIFFNPAAPTREWVDFLKIARSERPAVPVFIILEAGSNTKLTGLDIRKFGIRESLEKPTDYSVLLDLVRPAVLSFDAEEALRKARRNPDGADAGTQSAQDTDYVAIRAQDFLSGSKSYFDVYVRLTSGRHLKLLQAGDSFEHERVENYIRKGVTHFFILKEIQETYLRYTGHLATALVQHKVAPPELKAAQILNQGEQTLLFLRSSGLKPADILYATQFAANVSEFTRQLKLSQNPIFRGFMNSMAAYDHGVGTSLIAGLLARELDIMHQRSVELVGMAALLHDIGMMGMPESIQHADESRMSSDERQLYDTHPERGATMIVSMKGVDAAVVQAVRQHHMRKEGKGFPARPSSQRISMIAEVVGMASEFNCIIARIQDDREFNAPFEMEQRVLPLFSTNVAAGFRRAFMELASAIG